MEADLGALALLEILWDLIVPRDRRSHFCPHCHCSLASSDLRKTLHFECRACHSLLTRTFEPSEKYIRQAVILGVMFFYALRHGWDGGFVIFLLAFYGWAGLFTYFVFVAPLLPLRVEFVAPPVSGPYLDVKPLAKMEYESRTKSLRPLRIT